MTKTVFTETYFIAAACCAAPFSQRELIFPVFAGYGGLLTPKAQGSFLFAAAFCKKSGSRAKRA